MKLFRLNFKDNPIHIADSKQDYAASSRRLHSDTLYAAIYNVLVSSKDTGVSSLYEDGHPNFTLSSAFPFTRELETQDIIYFLPRPMKDFAWHDANMRNKFKEKSKELKKIEWFDIEYFKMIASGDCIPKSIFAIQKNFLSNKKIDISFVETAVTQRVFVPRANEDSEPFYFENMYFSHGSGLYFLFSGTNDEFLKVKRAINLLSKSGLGSDRTVGLGLFDFEVEDMPEIFRDIVTPNEAAKHAVNLSLFVPGSKSILESSLSSEESGYTLVRRGGWITSESALTYKKKAIGMFQEGSIFFSKELIAGKTIDVTPTIFTTHKIWRTGKSMFVPIIC